MSRYRVALTVRNNAPAFFGVYDMLVKRRGQFNGRLVSEHPTEDAANIARDALEFPETNALDTLLNARELSELESMLDRTSLSRMLESLAHICAEKSEHVQSNWQDQRLANDWAHAGSGVDRCSQHSAVVRVSK